MILVPGGVIWGGYTLFWWGYTMLKGKGIGIADLVMPANVGKVDGWLKAPKTASATSGNPSYIPGPGVQPGSPSYPSNPSGGLPSKPPLGGTPPAYYG